MSEEEKKDVESKEQKSGNGKEEIQKSKEEKSKEIETKKEVKTQEKETAKEKPPKTPAKKKKKINKMSLEEIEDKLIQVKSNMGNLYSKYAKTLLKRKEELLSLSK